MPVRDADSRLEKNVFSGRNFSRVELEPQNTSRRNDQFLCLDPRD